MKSIAFVDAGMLRPSIVANRLNLNSNQRFDWVLFIKWLESLNDGLFDIHYYDAVFDMPTSGINGFHTFLQQELKIQLHLTEIRSKRRTCPCCGGDFSEERQKGVDVSLAIDMYRLAPYYDQAILVSGDGDFGSTVQMLRSDFAKRVMVIGWANGIAPKLKIHANKIIQLEDHGRELISCD